MTDEADHEKESPDTTKVPVEIWRGAYDGGWETLICEAAFSHPAKFARGLIERIFKHMLQQGWLKKGDAVVDPFGGVACGGVVAAGFGLKWIGVELEKRFAILGNQNIQLNSKHWCCCGEDGRAYLRCLQEVVSTPSRAGEPQAKGQGGSVLFAELLEQGDLHGEASVGVAQGEAARQDSLEQGQELVAGSAGEDRGGSAGQSVDGEKWQLEGRQEHARPGVCSDPRERQAETGTSARDGAEAVSDAEIDGAGASRGRGQAEQPTGQPGAAQPVEPHEAPQSAGTEAADGDGDLPVLRPATPDEGDEAFKSLCLRLARLSQAAADGVPAEVRGQAICPTCGKFLTPIPVLLNGDSRKLRENLRVVLADAVACSPPFENDLAKVSNKGIGSSEYGNGGKHIVERRTAWEKLDHDEFGGYLRERRELLGLSKAEVDRQMGTNTAYSFWEGRKGSKDQWRIPLPTMYRKLKEILALDDRYDETLLSTEMIEVERRAMKMGHKEIDYGQTPGQLGAMKPGEIAAVISSPPYAESLKGDNSEQETAEDSRAKRVTEGGSLGQSCRHSGYGGENNLGNLKAGDVDAVVTSPPFVQTPGGAKGINVNGYGPDGADKVGDRTYQGIGGDREDGNLEVMPQGTVQAAVDGIVTSPPWENQEPSHAQGSKFEEEHRRIHPTKLAKDRPSIFQHEYGDSEGQIGNDSGETFWGAARDIVRECFAILKPGGYAAWVVKAFVRNKQIVDFPGDWQKLCEACGFETVLEVRAMLVKESRHPDLFGGDDHVQKTERKSFFRRLYEKKYPENAINYEVVLFCRKPLAINQEPARE